MYNVPASEPSTQPPLPGTVVVWRGLRVATLTVLRTEVQSDGKLWVRLRCDRGHLYGVPLSQFRF